MKQRIFAAAILLAALLAFSSCGGNSPAESSLPESSAASLPEESSEESSDSSQEESGEAVLWGGVYASENDGILTIEMMDNNSFEFTLTAGEDALDAQVARITEPGQAAYTGKDGVRLHFSYQNGTIQVTAEDSTGAEFEGEYSSD